MHFLASQTKDFGLFPNSNLNIYKFHNYCMHASDTVCTGFSVVQDPPPAGCSSDAGDKAGSPTNEAGTTGSDLDPETLTLHNTFMDIVVR